MKKVLFLLLVLPIIVSAQIHWQEDGISVRQGVNIEWSRAAASLEDGSVVYVWSDTRMGDRDIWAQKVDGNGNLLWGDDGILVNGEINRQEDPVVINTQDAGVIIAWVDFRNEDAGDVYAQKLDADGNLQWNSAGIPLCIVEDVQISLNIVADNSSGAYVIWLDKRNPGGADIYGTHIDSVGTIVAGWDQNGNPIASENGIQSQHTFWEDGSGRAILAWHDTRNPDNENLYMQRISPDGTLLWGEGGIPLCDEAGTQENVKIAPDGSGYFIFVWRDKRYENNGDIFSQRIDLDGNLLWENDVEICVDVGIQENPRITSSSDDGAIVVWEDGRNDPFSLDIFSQKIDTDGNLLWLETGVPLCISENDQLEPRLINDGNGGCYFAWEDERLAGHPHEDIYMQHLDYQGNILWQENGKPICNETGEQFSPLLRRNGSDNAYAVWGDNRTGSTGIYIQILDSEGDALLDENGEIIFYGLCGDAKNYKLLSTRENSIIIWEDSRDPYSGKKIFMQVLNKDGSARLEENGETITSATGFDQENADIVLGSDSTQIVIVWEEPRAENKQVFAQALDIDGNLLWSDEGLEISSIISDQYGVRTSQGYEENRLDSYYIGWTDYNLDFMNPIIKICGQKVQNGQLQWGSQGIAIADMAGDDVLTDLVGRFFIWQNENWPNYDIYVKLVDEDGNTASGWSDDGLLVCGASGNQQNAKGVMTSQGLLVVWEDKRNENADIYGQIINYDGNILWQEDGIPLIALGDDQSKPAFSFSDEIYLAWNDFRSGLDYNVYLQKYDENGDELWTSGGIQIASYASDNSSPSLSEIENNIVIAWEDCRTDTLTDIYLQKISLDGEPQWNNEGLLVCGAIKNQTAPLVAKQDDNCVVIWQDSRSSGKAEIYNIYAQKVYIEPVQTIIYGDVNGDSVVTSYDAALTLQYSAGLSEFEDWQITAGDVNGDDAVTSYDAALILQYSAGLIDEFPIEGGKKRQRENGNGRIQKTECKKQKL